MAKSVKSEVVKSKPSKSKTPAQLAKRDRNIVEAKARLERVQTWQRLVVEARRLGYMGSDAEVVAQKRVADERREINASLCGPSGVVLERWLAGRHLRYPHADVLRLVRRFFAERSHLPRYKQAA